MQETTLLEADSLFFSLSSNNGIKFSIRGKNFTALKKMCKAMLQMYLP
jgi:hypothetical protein